MRLCDLIKITNGNLSICGVMIGDELNEQRDKMIKEGVTLDNWTLLNGQTLVNTLVNVTASYLINATLILEGFSINRIMLQAEFSSYPNSIADSLQIRHLSFEFNEIRLSINTRHIMRFGMLKLM